MQASCFAFQHVINFESSSNGNTQCSRGLDQTRKCHIVIALIIAMRPSHVFHLLIDQVFWSDHVYSTATSSAV